MPEDVGDQHVCADHRQCQCKPVAIRRLIQLHRLRSIRLVAVKYSLFNQF